MKKLEKRSVTPEQAVEIYGLNAGHLANLRYRREGPKFYKKGRRVYYKVADLELWLFSEPIQTRESI